MGYSLEEQAAAQQQRNDQAQAQWEIEKGWYQCGWGQPKQSSVYVKGDPWDRSFTFWWLVLMVGGIALAVRSHLIAGPNDEWWHFALAAFSPVAVALLLYPFISAAHTKRREGMAVIIMLAVEFLIWHPWINYGN